ncbi:MAG: helix-turn-helix domain-containing protein [Bdellovibrionaceae bacterium]|nr:helix-turn-helix domain-containing protein [Pseudobdellovibrionaceae bacterium]MBX3032688.1 helix-turn-helix domain-containing protein [Pseudobdellovibrionaceae bacterium]
MSQYSRLGQLLFEARKRSGLTQQQVADRLQLKSGQSISDIERREDIRIPIKTLRRLIELYQLEAGPTFDLYLENEKIRLEKKLLKQFQKG